MVTNSIAILIVRNGITAILQRTECTRVIMLVSILVWQGKQGSEIRCNANGIEVCSIRTLDPR